MTTVSRRGVVVGAVAVAAAAAGAGWAWHRGRQADGDAASAPLRALRVPAPGGGEVALASFAGRPLVVNFWATWCPPCVEELPLLDGFHRRVQPRGWQVVGLAVDRDAPVRDFLARRPVGFPVGLVGTQGLELARSLGNDAGGLPFTLLLDAQGRIAERRVGRVDAALLDGWLRRHDG